MAAASARQDIIDAALRLLEDRPPSAISGRELAEEAGVNYGLIHYYFNGKQNAFLAARDFFNRWVVDSVMQGGSQPVSLSDTSDRRSLWAVAGHMALEASKEWNEERDLPVVEAYLNLFAQTDPSGDRVQHADVVASLYALLLGRPIFGAHNAHSVGLTDEDLPKVDQRIRSLVSDLEGSVGLEQQT